MKNGRKAEKRSSLGFERLGFVLNIPFFKYNLFIYNSKLNKKRHFRSKSTDSFIFTCEYFINHKSKQLSITKMYKFLVHNLLKMI